MILQTILFPLLMCSTKARRLLKRHRTWILLPLFRKMGRAFYRRSWRNHRPKLGKSNKREAKQANRRRETRTNFEWRTSGSWVRIALAEPRRDAEMKISRNEVGVEATNISSSSFFTFQITHIRFDVRLFVVRICAVVRPYRISIDSTMKTSVQRTPNAQ